MSFDRRIDETRVVIDGVLLLRATGKGTMSCAICEVTLIAGEERYVPVGHSSTRKRLVDGRRTRLCPACVAARIEASAARRAT